MTFSDKLKQCRIMKDYTPKEMATLIDVNYNTYLRYENGKSQPNVDILKRIVKVLDIDANYLLTDDDSELILAIIK